MVSWNASHSASSRCAPAFATAHGLPRHRVQLPLPLRGTRSRVLKQAPTAPLRQPRILVRRQALLARSSGRICPQRPQALQAPPRLSVASGWRRARCGQRCVHTWWGRISAGRPPVRRPCRSLSPSHVISQGRARHGARRRARTTAPCIDAASGGAPLSLSGEGAAACRERASGDGRTHGGRCTLAVRRRGRAHGPPVSLCCASGWRCGAELACQGTVRKNREELWQGSRAVRLVMHGDAQRGDCTHRHSLDIGRRLAHSRACRGCHAREPRTRVAMPAVWSRTDRRDRGSSGSHSAGGGLLCAVARRSRLVCVPPAGPAPVTRCATAVPTTLARRQDLLALWHGAVVETADGAAHIPGNRAHAHAHTKTQPVIGCHSSLHEERLARCMREFARLQRQALVQMPSTTSCLSRLHERGRTVMQRKVARAQEVSAQGTP